MNSESTSSSVTDLLADLGVWSTWGPRAEIEPRYESDPAGGPDDSPALAVHGGGNPLACGCWQRPLPPLGKGRRYRIEAAFRTAGVAHPGHSVWAITTRGTGEKAGLYMELEHEGERDGWERMALVIDTPQDMDDLVLRLYLAWSADGSVRWSDVEMRDITDVEPSKRIVHLAAISGRPSKPTSQSDCMDFYCERLDTIGSQGVDLVCLPETINTDGLSGLTADLAEPIPGPSFDRLAEMARTHKMSVAASLVERDGEAIYNTGVLITRDGEVVGKYRKTHITIGEGLLDGKAPGAAYPVFDTDIGKIGYMICYDNHYPEVSRILAVKGADILVFSNMGDGREGGTLWETYMRTRALDNQVHIVAAVNGGRSCIVSPKAEVLAINDRTPGAIVSARCDLDSSVCDSTGRPISKRYLRIRRAETFPPLSRHYWELA